MKITRASDYAIRVILFLALQPKDKYFMRGELSEKCSIPDSFLGKLLQFLVKADMLYSERGKKGGFKLKKEPKDISLYDIIVSVEGDIQINECLTDTYSCSESFHCSIHNALNTIRNNMINELKQYTVEKLINEQTQKIT